MHTNPTKTSISKDASRLMSSLVQGFRQELSGRRNTSDSSALWASIEPYSAQDVAFADAYEARMMAAAEGRVRCISDGSLEHYKRQLFSAAVTPCPCFVFLVG